MLSKTQEKIHRSAMRHFLKDGFQRASLRKIVSDAGFTLGAFYGYYESKEELFCALVDDTAKDIITIISNMGDSADRLIPGRDLKGMSGVFADGLPALVDCLLQHEQETRLLLRCSEGTRYEDFLAGLMERDLDFVRGMTGGSLPFHPLAARLLVNGYFTMLGDAVLSGGSREDIMQAMQDIEDVFAGGVISILKGKSRYESI